MCRHDTLHKPQDIAKTAGIRTAALNCVHLPCTAVHDWSTLFQNFLRKEFCIFLPKATRTCIVKWQHKLKSSKVYSHSIPWRKRLPSQFATSSTRLTLLRKYTVCKKQFLCFATKLNQSMLRKSLVYSKPHQFLFHIISTLTSLCIRYHLAILWIHLQLKWSFERPNEHLQSSFLTTFLISCFQINR